MQSDGPLTSASRKKRAPSPHGEIEAKIGRIGEQLGRSLRSVLDAIPGAPRRPVDLAKAIGVNQVLACKLLLATGNRDPLVVTHTMPGPEALRSLLKAAARVKVGKRLLDEAERAIEQFEHLIKNVVGGRTELDAILSAWVPEARQRFELSNKQAAFKAMSALKGVMAELSSTTVFYMPSEQPRRVDSVFLECHLGLRRLRPGAMVQVDNTLLGPEHNQDSHSTFETLDGRRPSADHSEFLLKDFVASTSLRYEVDHKACRAYFVLDDNRVGLETAVDLVFGYAARGMTALYTPRGQPRKLGLGQIVQICTKLLVVDTLIHPDVIADTKPGLGLYDTLPRGSIDINDGLPDELIYHLAETVQPLGQGISKCRIAESPRYLEMLRHVCEHRGWDGEELLAYRCRIRYPIYGSAVFLTFDRLEEPEEPTE